MYGEIAVGLAGLAAGAGVVAALQARRAITASAPSSSHDDGGRQVANILNALPTAVVVVDRAGVIRTANIAARAFGLIDGDTLTTKFRLLARRSRQDGALHEDVEVHTDTQEMSLRVQAIPSSDGEVVLLAEDHTESLRVETIRRDFVANVSHELKTPVGAVSLLAETLVEARDDPEAVAQFGERLQQEAHRLTRLVDDLIQLSRVQGAVPANAEPVSVRDLVAEATDRNRVAAAGRAITLEVAEPPAVSVIGDARQLCTALSNIIENAVAYSIAGGHVGVGVKHESDVVDIVVTDNGIGIAAADLPRVFERFYRVDPARSRATGGTGLGLAIAKHIVNNHGGTIRVWSEEGKGSSFTMRLPAAERATP